jgi:penicillin-binding protein 2
VEVAGKTGTAQVVHQGDSKIPESQIPWEKRDHAWFVCYAPARAPEIAVVVLIEHGGHGGSVAAPVAKKIMEAYFQGKGQPTPLGQK